MMLDRTQAPPLQVIPPLEVTPPDKLVLPNGVPLFLRDGGEQPIIQLDLVLCSGTWYSPAPGVAQLTAAMLQEGTSRRDAQAIAETIARYGAQLSIRTGADFITLQLAVLREHAEPLLELLHELLTAPRFSEDSLQVVKQRQQQQLQLQLAQNDFLAAKLLKDLLYGTMHPYGHTLTAEEIDAVTLQHLRQYHRQQLLTGAMAFVSGQVAGLESLFEQYLGHLSLPTGCRYTPQEMVYLPQRIQHPAPNSLQAAVAMGKPVCAPTHDDYMLLYASTTLLGGYFGSRLMQHLREDKGYTYGIYATLRLHVHAAHLWIAADVVHTHAREACMAVDEELQRLIDAPVQQKEWEILRNYLQGSLLGSYEGVHGQLQQFKNAYLCGLPYDYPAKLWRTLQQLDVAQLQAVTKRYFSPDSFAQALVMSNHETGS